jgi:hypothetical protein
MRKAIRIVGWAVLSPVFAAQIVPMVVAFYTRHLFRRVMRNEPIPGLRAFWANPKA